MPLIANTALSLRPPWDAVSVLPALQFSCIATTTRANHIVIGDGSLAKPEASPASIRSTNAPASSGASDDASDGAHGVVACQAARRGGAAALLGCGQLYEWRRCVCGWRARRRLREAAWTRSRRH